MNPRVMFGHVPSAMSVLKQNALMNSSLALFSSQLQDVETRIKDEIG